MIARQKTVRKHAFPTPTCACQELGRISFRWESMAGHAPTTRFATASDNVTQISDLSAPAKAEKGPSLAWRC